MGRMSGVSLNMKRVLPAIGLFLAAPLIAEYLPGILPITMLGTLVVLAPMYGGGAILIRETVRRAGLGWPSILVLALAYGVLEEGLVTQSLFNPNYLGLNQHLLQPEYIPALGIGAWWTVFVLTLHAVWSIPVSIAIVEGLATRSAAQPWLRPPGLALVAILFALGCISIARFTIREDAAHFVASRAHLASTAAIIGALTVLAFRLPQSSGVHGQRSAPRYSIVGLTALIAGSAFLIIPNQWGWVHRSPSENFGRQAVRPRGRSRNRSELRSCRAKRPAPTPSRSADRSRREWGNRKARWPHRSPRKWQSRRAARGRSIHERR